MKLRSLIATGMLLLSIMSASAKVELPVTQVNGKACYCYTVGRQQTLYSVADELGLSRDEIVKYNPAANDGVKKGQVLYFPVDKFPDLGNSSAATDAVNGTYTVKKGDSFYGICYKLGVSSDALLAANPSIASGVKVGQELKIPSEAIQQEISDESLNNQNDQRLSLTPVRPVIVPIDTNGSPDAVEQAADRSASIVAMLPFMLNSKESDKHALIATDFYKGMLLAADSLKNKSGQINIYAFDTEGSTERVRNFCQSDTFRNASVIIAPDDPEQLALIASHASGNQYVFNAFIVKDNSYTSNPHMLQSYIPSDAMLHKAAMAVKELYPGATPVVLRRNGARQDKADFINQLTDVFSTTDTPVINLDFSEILTSDDLAKLPSGKSYVLIPSSGSLPEFNKISGAIIEAIQDAAGGSTYSLFGYPDWTSFRGPTREMLHRLGATIYTRFYFDPFSVQVKDIEAKYNSDFGGAMVDAVPSPALLGFDTAHFLIDNLRRGESEYVPRNDAFYGIQSSFHFVTPDSPAEGGFYNDELYIIRFSIDGIHTDRLQ